MTLKEYHDAEDRYGLKRVEVVNGIQIRRKSKVAIGDTIYRLRQRLRELGYVEGQNLAIEWRFWDGNPDRLNKYVAEVVGLKVDVIFGNNTATIQAAKKGTTTIPIVMQLAGDPVENGLVASPEHPGGNVTGLTSASSALYGKRLELAKEIVPKLLRVGVLWEPAYVALTGSRTFKEVEAATGALQVKLEPLEVGSREEFENAFRKASMPTHKPSFTSSIR